MSGGMDGAPEQERIVLAGEYVLGTLPADERARVEREMARDAALRDAVAGWERRLLPLAMIAPHVLPPEALWRRIRRDMRAPGAATRDRFARSGGGRSGGWRLGGWWAGGWRVDASRIGGSRTDGWRVDGSRVGAAAGPGQRTVVAAAALLLAACVAFVLLADRTPPAVPVAALSAPGGPDAAFVVEARPDGALLVLPLHPSPVPAGRDLELWSLAAGDPTPRPLGVLPAAGRTLRAGTLPRGGTRLLVSLEPRGGSPGGRPTGPVLYGGTVPVSD